MAKLNRKTATMVAPKTHEGASTKRINKESQLRRSVMSCMLWEDSFYEDGVSITKRIRQLVHENKAPVVAQIAIEAREEMKLRHVPLLLVRELARHKSKDEVGVSATLARVIQRADEISEFLALYWKDGKCPISAQVKKGLRNAFNKFSEYDLAKYNRDADIKLRDVGFLTHIKPKDREQGVLFAKLLNKDHYPSKTGSGFDVKRSYRLKDFEPLETPDTWEVALSAGKDKKTTFERLLKEKKLGALALLRNLRNMVQSGVKEKSITDALKDIKVDRVLPFRFISAARYAPKHEPELEQAMFKCIEGRKKLPGKTILLVDVSGSMDDPISIKSEMKSLDAACGLAILMRETCERVEVFTFSDLTKQVPARKGFALRDAIVNSQPHNGTDLGHALEYVAKLDYDRVIVFTDEQSRTRVGQPEKLGYMINIASYQNGVGYGDWLHIDGFSEAVLDFILEYEKPDRQ